MPRVLLSLPNALSCSRLAAVPAIVYASVRGDSRMFLALVGYALVSDVADGRLARALGQVTLTGAQLDSLADCALYMTMPAAVVLVYPQLRLAEPLALAAIIASYAVPILYGYLKFRKLTAYHTIGARTAGVALTAAFCLFLLTGATWYFRPAALILAASALEEIAITRVLSVWQANVPSLRRLMARHRRRATPANVALFSRGS